MTNLPARPAAIDQQILAGDKDPVSHYDLFKILKEGTPEEFRKAMYLSVYYNTIRK